MPCAVCAGNASGIRSIPAIHQGGADRGRSTLHVNDWAQAGHSFTIVAARKGLGEIRPLLEAPAHYFDPYPYDERDQTAISSEQPRETGILVGLMALIMIDGWDGWLIAANADRIEFWEGNLFFYSHEAARIAAAEAVIAEFGCPRTIG